MSQTDGTTTRPAHHFRGELRQVCVFCGSSRGVRPGYVKVAQELGSLLATEGIGLVYGGGSIGLMAELADAALAAGGKVTGVMPEHLTSQELAHRGLSELRVVSSMHERKALMYDLSDGFVALPGGLGTLEELFEITTWCQLGLHVKPIGLLNVENYFSPLVELLDHFVTEGFLQEAHRRLLLVDAHPERLLASMRAFRPPSLPPLLRAQER